MLLSLKKQFSHFLHACIDWVMASGHVSRGISGFSVTGGGTGTDAVVLSAYGVPDMADTAYQVLVNGETTAATKVDESTKTTTGFNVLGLALNEVGHVIVHGRFSGMPTE